MSLTVSIRMRLIVRGMSVSLTDLPVLLQTIKSGGVLGQNVPKSADKEDSE